MIELPKRSVTRFFIPLIDVLTLMFCIFLLMPVVKPSDEEAGGTNPPRAEAVPALERQELDRLRKERNQWRDLKNLDEQKTLLQTQLDELRSRKIEALQNRLAIRVLEIGDDGRLFAYDLTRDQDRRLEITRDNVDQFIAAQRRKAGSDDLYFLLVYPRPASGLPAFPLRSQREEYDRWFQGVAHGYDIR
jgi:hypothetical protein